MRATARLHDAGPSHQENYVWLFAPYCTLLHLNTFVLRHDKIKNFMVAFSTLFFAHLMLKSFNFFYVFM